MEYAAVGELDPLLRFASAGPGESTVRERQQLFVAIGGIAPNELASPGTWRIEKATPDQWITVNAAIRYVTKKRDPQPIRP